MGVLLGGLWLVMIIKGAISPLVWGYNYTYPAYNRTYNYP